MIKNAYFHHTSIRVKDYEATKKFYAALGLQLYIEWEENGNHCCFMKIDDQTFLEFKEFHEETKYPGQLQHICFHCDDVDALYQIAVSNGARTRRPPLDFPLLCAPKPIERARICHIYGPNDEEIEIINWYGFRI